MEVAFEILRPHRELVAQAVTYSTLLQFVGGAIACYKIHKNGSTREANSVSIIQGIVMSILCLKCGYMNDEVVTINVNLVGTFLNLLYLCIYFKYATNKYSEIFEPLTYGVAVVGIILGYLEWESPSVVGFRFGLILTVLVIGLLIGPLKDIKNIIKSHNVGNISFPFTLLAAISTMSWVMYGIILQNNFMIIHNLMFYSLSVIQLMLFVKYYKHATIKPKSKKSKKQH